MSGLPPAKPDCVFFDFDGVIVDSLEAKIAAFGDLYAEFGAEVRASVEAYQRAVPGETRYAKIPRFHRELLGIELSQAEIAAWAERLRHIVADRVIACPLLPGVTQTLALLARRGTCAHVVSGTPEDELAAIAEAKGLTPFFRSLRGSPRTKPEIVREILSAEGFAPENCLFVGDAISDHACAEQCGLGFLGRAGRAHPFPDGTVVVENLLEFFAVDRDPGAPKRTRAA
ncbi:MAG: HAD hydrolase-like protein [Erythrobacter sp.]